MDNLESMSPEERQEVADSVVASLDDETAQSLLDRIKRNDLAEKAREDSVDGFAAFYEVIWSRPLPQHAREWVEAMHSAKKKGKGIVIEAFRGSTKTTTVTITWVAWRWGLKPELSNLLIQVGDDIARDNPSQIADIVANNPGWKEVYPNIVPDEKAGWGSSGYEVKISNMNYGEWRKLRSKMGGKDPGLIGLGYKSRAIIGKHPTGILLVDDIHDENNTASMKELDKVLKILTGTILPTITPGMWVVIIGTPWVKNDVLGYLKATGQFENISTPVWDKEEVPVWPEKFNEEEIQKQKELAGSIEFARMFLLDLEAASGIHLKREWLHTFPHKDIDTTWPVVMGVDYASTADEKTGTERDYFTIAVGRAIPGGRGVVLVDGFRGRISQGEAQERLKSMAAMYPTTQLVAIESVGKGEEFMHLMMRTSRLPIVAVTPGRMKKGRRFEREMAPLFEFNRAFLTDIEIPFIKHFRREWVQWPLEEHDDCLDAVYWMLYVGIPHMMSTEIADVKEKMRGVRKRKEKPFAHAWSNE